MTKSMSLKGLYKLIFKKTTITSNRKKMAKDIVKSVRYIKMANKYEKGKKIHFL